MSNITVVVEHAMNKIKHLLKIVVPFAILIAVIAAVGPVDRSAAQSFGVTVSPNRERINVRIAPAIGHEVIGVLARGQTVDAYGRSPNNQWLRINFFGQEGWVEMTVLDVTGDWQALPFGGPAVAPLDLGDGPRAGVSNSPGPGEILLPESGIRLRGGPSEAYFVLVNIPRFEIMAVTGRSTNGEWLQVQYRGTLGWIKNLGLPFIDWRRGSMEVLPEWGIVADAPPSNAPDPGPYATRDAIFVAMLLHIDRSTYRLDQISGVWSTISSGGSTRHLCMFDLGEPQPYIPRERDLLEYPELDPVIAALNEGLEETGHAIERWHTWCDMKEQRHPGKELLVEPALENLRNARQGYESAEAQIWGMGLEPTPTPVPPAFTPAAPVATATPLPDDLPDLQAFALDGNRVLFTGQFTHPELGCSWQGFGGQVVGIYGEPLTGFTVRVEGVTDPTLIQTTVSGAEPAYGAGGWEVKIADGVNSHVFRVTLYQNERRVSDPRQVGFPSDCARNLAVLNFTQITPLQ